MPATQQQRQIELASLREEDNPLLRTFALCQYVRDTHLDHQRLIGMLDSVSERLSSMSVPKQD